MDLKPEAIKRTRAAILLIEDGQVALIERTREGEVYYLFPGGGVESGESAPQAAEREALEELGLSVEVGSLIAEVSYGGNLQLFFAARRLSGVFGSGEGEEMQGDQGKHGTYRALWLPLSSLHEHQIHPQRLIRLIQSDRGAWLGRILRFEDSGRSRLSA